MTELKGKRAVVVGAGRGLGRGIAASLSTAGASVLAIARGRAGLDELQAEHRSIEVSVADAIDPSLAGKVLYENDPDILALIAGASPLLHPIHHHTWETFSVPWEVDVRLTFNWLREALLKPLRPGGRVLVMSSGAAVRGSPLSGGYAGAKATIRFMAEYADDEARRADLGIRVVAILPRLTPATELGRAATRAYAERKGVPLAEYTASFGSPVTPADAGDAFVSLASIELDGSGAFELSGDQGLTRLGA